ncbi:MAG: hypothetical protein J5803_05490, partial [Desulfovibrio sp.]|nr:hypothetical protein [Desulfovibrio sp.]
MQRLILVTPEAEVSLTKQSSLSHSEDCLFILHWDSWSVPEGHYSLPFLLQSKLERIRSEHAAWAYELGSTYIEGKRVDEWLLGGETLSMWWCSLLYERHPKMTPSLYSIFRLRALELFLKEKKAESILLLGGDQRLATTLRGFCCTTNRLFSWRPCQEENKTSQFLSHCYQALPSLCKAVVRFVDWLLRVKRHLPRTFLQKSTQKTATIVTYFPNIDMEKAKEGRFLSRYWESLHTTLNHEAEKEGAHFVRWLFIRFPSPQGSLPALHALCDRFTKEKKDGLSFHYLEEFVSTKDLLLVWKRFLALRKASFFLEKHLLPLFHLPSSFINFAAYLHDDFKESFRGWRCLERCMQYQGIRTLVREAGPARWTLFPLENCPWERMVTHAVHDMGFGPVYGAQHSTLRPTDLRYFDDPRIFSSVETGIPVPDRILGNGKSAFTQWESAGVPRQKLGMVEALRYLYLAGNDVETVEENDAEAEAPRTRKTLLVLTSFFKDETEEHMRLFVEAYAKGLFDGWHL